MIAISLAEMRKKLASEPYKSFILTKMQDYVVEMILDGNLEFFVIGNSLVLFLILFLEFLIVVKKKHLILFPNSIMD